MPVAPQVTHPGVYIQELPGNENKCQVTNQVSLDCHTREGGFHAFGFLPSQEE